MIVWTLTRAELFSALARGQRQEPGAALAAAEDDPATRDFVTLDRQQALAAEREGFRVLGP